MDCGHDEHASDHALTVVDTADLNPMISGVRCAHDIRRSRYTCYDTVVSFGDRFTVFATCNISYNQYLCHYDGNKPVVFTQPKHEIYKLHAANQVAYYAAVKTAFRPPVARFDRNKEDYTGMTYMSDLYYESQKIRMSVSLDDSMMFTSQKSLYTANTRILLVDIATERDIRVRIPDNNNFPHRMSAQDRHTWVVAGCEDTSDLQIYDDRTSEWLMASYRVAKCAEIKLTSCVDNIALASIYDFNLNSANPLSIVHICAFDIRNFDRYTLANLCPMASFMHLQL